MSWNVLDIGSIWMKEFTSVLGGFVPVMGWTAFIQKSEREGRLSDSLLTYRSSPLQRGYHRFPLCTLSNWSTAQVNRMQRCSSPAENSPLVCTTPFYAPVVEKWPEPVVYYQTDLTFGYAGINPKQVRALERRLCRATTAVCPNSKHVADYRVVEAQWLVGRRVGKDLDRSGRQWL